MKKQTIATAEKRVIKAEISTLKRAAKKISADTTKEYRRIIKAHHALDRETQRISKSCDRETAAINRRLAILTGRL
jgi:hypothetical protein